MSKTFPVEERNRVRRAPKRAAYDEDTVFSILDDGTVGHVAMVHNDRAAVIPMFYVRMGDELLFHGSTKSRLMEQLYAGGEVCMTVTHLDGYVLARSAFHHSMNYRSVVVFGRGRLLTSDEEKDAAARAITEKIAAGRWKDTRPPSVQEYKATSLVAVKIESASAKVRSGGPIDDDDDMDLPHWSGVIPIEVVKGEPVQDPAQDTGVAFPDYLKK